MVFNKVEILAATGGGWDAAATIVLVVFLIIIVAIVIFYFRPKMCSWFRLRKQERAAQKEARRKEKEEALKAKQEAERKAAEEKQRQLQLSVNPYDHYPTFYVTLDATGKRGAAAEPKDMVEEYIITNNFYSISGHHHAVEDWFKQKEKEIEEMPDWLKDKRRQQLNSAKWSADRYHFTIIKKHKRTRTVNYMKQTWYQEEVLHNTSYGYAQLSKMNEELKKIGYSCTTRKNATAGQRALMTKELKQKILKRDNYTCQICGYRDPTCNGLHVDHIVPVSRGGLTIESNLQVLCRTCNLKKSNKVKP